MNKSILLLFFLLLFASGLNAQDKIPWHNKKAAIALTYDDALEAQLDNAVPLLDSLGLNATFYLTGHFPGFSEHIDRWKAVAENGHELGNHTLFHPCKGDAPGREWVQPANNLNNYNLVRMINEITMTNVLLKAVDGKSTRTFAYPCGDTAAGDSSYIDEIKEHFIAARGVQSATESIDSINLYNIDSYMIHDRTGDEMIDLVKQAMEEKGLVVFLFHGVGGGHSLNVSLEAHRKLLHFLKENEQEIWTAPMIDIAEHVKNYRSSSK